MAVNYTIDGTNGLLNLKAEQVFINGAHSYKTQATVPQNGTKSGENRHQYKHINAKARHSVL